MAAIKLPEKLNSAELPAEIVNLALNADKKDILSDRYPHKKRMKKGEYEEELYLLHIELVKFQRWINENDQRVLVLFEGRDAAGKGGCIKRIREHINPRHAKVIALSKPTDMERGQWYFQRYVYHLPTKGDIAIFDRSWYNRGGVEKVMGFCSPEQNKTFLKEAPRLENMLVDDGIHLVKFWLSVSRAEQLRRFIARSSDPLKQWKLSPIDLASLSKWEDYSVARDEIFDATSSSYAPWTVVLSDDKKRARINVIKYLLNQFDYDQKDRALVSSLDNEILGHSKDFSD